MSGRTTVPFWHLQLGLGVHCIFIRGLDQVDRSALAETLLEKTNRYQREKNGCVPDAART